MAFYNGDKIFNNNSIFKIVCGNRSGGKTFYYKLKCVQHFLETGRKFVFMRRYITELDTIKDELFNDIQEYLDNEVYIEVKGYDIFINNHLAGKFVSLTSYAKYKSVNMSEYDIIVFDEFIPEDNMYLKSKINYCYEPEICMNFYQSVARGLNKSFREGVKFIFISNAISTSNPYFAYFKIQNRIWNNQKKFYKDDVVSYEIVQIDTKIEETSLGKFLSNTNYGKYAMNNQFYLDKQFCIKKELQKNAFCIYNISFNNKIYGVYRYDNTIHVHKSYVKNKRTYSLEIDGEYPFFKNSYECSSLQNLAKNNRVLFYDVSIKNIILEY